VAESDNTITDEITPNHPLGQALLIRLVDQTTSAGEVRPETLEEVLPGHLLNLAVWEGVLDSDYSSCAL
jgi:hypothetical protein